MCLFIPLVILQAWFFLHSWPRPPYRHPSYPLHILSSTQSLTGLIVVGEGLLRRDAKNPIRYLRASHSILGGVWTEKNAIAETDTEVVDDTGTSLGDSIYSTFVLQEATRLVNGSHLQDKRDNVLVM